MNRQSLIPAALAALVLCASAPTAFADAARVRPRPDALRAIQARLAAGGGVALTEKSSTRMPGGRIVDHMSYSAGYNVERKGRLRLGRPGVLAAETWRRLSFGTGVAKQIATDTAKGGDAYVASLLPQTSWHHSISVGGHLYASGRLYDPVLPQGKSWARLKNVSGAAAAYGDQLLNVFEPATAKALITEKNRKGDGYEFREPDGRKHWELQYAGALSFAAMYKLSATFREALNGRLDSADRTLQLNWSVFVDDKGLPLRVVSFWENRQDGRFFTSETVTSYSGWGSRTAITAPPSSRTAVTRGPAGPPESDGTVDVLRARPATG
ncbi:hypothetical protein [Streptosporangium saharense]|uniref:hypothetical protein n=1 Tax=Streptosporangium saharense TaxID=1706840 RepID=UPI0036C4F686